MEAQQSSGLNPTQLHLLKMFSFNNSEKFAREVQEVLSKHFQQRLDDITDRLWDEGILDQAALDRLRDVDFHAQMRQAQ